MDPAHTFVLARHYITTFTNTGSSSILRCGSSQKHRAIEEVTKTGVASSAIGEDWRGGVVGGEVPTACIVTGEPEERRGGIVCREEPEGNGVAGTETIDLLGVKGELYEDGPGSGASLYSLPFSSLPSSLLLCSHCRS